jgi:alpha/beta superfamily hydrolase
MRPSLRSALLVLVAHLAALPAGSQLAPAGTRLDLAAPDGARLAATYWAAPEPGPGVLLLHMCNSDRRAWNGLGPMLAARGIHALALDFRGYGESGGERFTEVERQVQVVRGQWPRDVDAAIDALRDWSGAEILGVAGGSCGVHQAVQAARRHPEIRTLVLLAGNTDVAGTDFLAAQPWLPVMAVAAHDDEGAVEGTRWVQQFSSNPANEFAEYRDGGHGTEIFRVHSDLEPRIADWFELHLSTKPVARPAAGSAEAAPRPGPSGQIAAELRRPGGAAAVQARAEAAKRTGRAFVPPPELAVNLLGYERLAANDAAGAIALFELNVALWPESANVHDSAADGYLAAGRAADAAAAARRAIALLPADPAADTPGQKAIRDAAMAKLPTPAPAAPPAP